MKNSENLKLGSVQETLLLPLWGRAVETLKKNPLLIDNKAVSIINNLSYDFSTISRNINKLIQAAWISRSIYFDKKIREFIRLYPEAAIVNIGCGLDTTFDRIDNGKIQWFDLDLPDTIELRKKFIEESDRRHFISASVFDKSWYNSVNSKNVMLLFAGVIYYFDEKEVSGLFKDFHNLIPGVEIIFDYSSNRGVKISNKKVIENSGMDKSAFLKWGIDDIYQIEKWDNFIKVISNMPMYKEHKKNFPIFQRLGMNIADCMKIMSLAHIKIN